MNWGNKLLVTFLVFAAGMGFLVYRSVKTNYELVEPDYYKTELAYQQTIDASNHANTLSSSILLKQAEKGIILQFPDEMKNKNVTGSVLFYCAYDQQKDKKIAIKVEADGTQLIPREIILPGNYTVKINWKGDEENYYTEKSLTVL
jgi:FixH